MTNIFNKNLKDSVRASVRASVGASVGASVWDSVRASVGDSVRDSVMDSVGASVGDSVGDSVWDYISSLFPRVKKWSYIDHEEGKNPFLPFLYLWKNGIVPSFSDKLWRLHTGKDAHIIWEGTL